MYACVINACAVPNSWPRRPLIRKLHIKWNKASGNILWKILEHICVRVWSFLSLFKDEQTHHYEDFCLDLLLPLQQSAKLCSVWLKIMSVQMMLGQPFGPSRLKLCDICCDPAAVLETQNNRVIQTHKRVFFCQVCSCWTENPASLVSRLGVNCGFAQPAFAAAAAAAGPPASCDCVCCLIFS